ncbi:MAG: decaprenyl-phosphate phosphoribosyltransferase [Spirochaetaceae bacterium]|jgi:4-hydroxybenzoate polyprenyltransferase|nr:decaprenyl-phosphate phosphoribosyltransferase [Spirochaetaceae bacterium]
MNGVQNKVCGRGLIDYLRLLRVHHYIKNGLVFIPGFFSFSLFERRAAAAFCLGFVIFSLLSSVVYIINDIKDIEKDRFHGTKRLRPLASGKIPAHHAVVVIILLVLILILLIVKLKNTAENIKFHALTGLLAAYLALNIGYSFGLKNIPIVDIIILASGYVIRVLFGAAIIGVGISVWLYLVITVGSCYLGLGKRRNEITGTNNGYETRPVMKFYSHNFLDKNMYMCQALCIVFYALWSIDTVTLQKLHTDAFVYTIPLVLVILLKYSLNIETNSDGDPTSVILNDKLLLALCVLYMTVSFFIVYMNRPGIMNIKEII